MQADKMLAYLEFVEQPKMEIHFKDGMEGKVLQSGALVGCESGSVENENDKLLVRFSGELKKMGR